MELTYSLFFCLLLPLISSLSPQLYSESQVVEVHEENVEKRQLGERKYSFEMFGEKVNMNLKHSVEFLPETLPVHFLDVDENGERVIEDFTHRTGGRDLYADPETGASILLDELNGETKLRGSILGQYVIEPVVEQRDDYILPRPKSMAKHIIYKTNISRYEEFGNDFLPQLDWSKEPLEEDVEEDIEKRQIPSRIYPSIHAVVDYSHYKKLGTASPQSVLDYTKILYHTAQVAHFSTMVNPSCQISLQGITVCKSDAACAELNKGKWSYTQYKYPFDNIGKFAYQEKGRTGTDYDLMFVTTSNKICPKPGECGVGGFGPMPGACSPFYSPTRSTNRGGIMIDNGGYDAVRGIGHEIGHMLNMPHDGDNNFPYARACQGGTQAGDYIMGQTKYSPHNWRYSSCSMHYLHDFLRKSSSNCIKSPPSRNQIQGWGSTYIAGRYMNADQQCSAIFGSGHKSCHSTRSKNDAICQHLTCNRYGPGRGGCAQFHLAAAEGTYCGPGMWCAKGYCVNGP